MNRRAKPSHAQPPSEGTLRTRGGVRRIAIGGPLLEDLLVPSESEWTAYESYRAFPGKEHSAAVDAQGVTLSLPTPAALQLYHEGVLPGDRAQPVELTLGRQRIGPLFVHWLRAQEVCSVNEHVLLRLERQPPAAALQQHQHDEHASLRRLAPPALHARGKVGLRTQWELERVLPGRGLDTLAKACAHIDAGRPSRAEPMLERLVRADGRCLEARALLGKMAFSNKRVARRTYEQAVLIGRQALGAAFDGLLPWAFEGNRAFLRSLHGLALCRWRADRFEEAEEVFRELLALDPADPLRIGETLELVSRDLPYAPRFMPVR